MERARDLKARIPYNNSNSGRHSLKKSDRARPHIYIYIYVYTPPSVRTCLWEFGQLHPKIDNQRPSMKHRLPTAPRGHVRLPLSRPRVTKTKVKSAKTKSISNTTCHILIPFYMCTHSHGGA